MENYIQALLDLGIFTDEIVADWHAAPLIVPKLNSKSPYRMAIELRPVHAATIQKAWPMPNLEAEMLEFARSTCFACLDFVSGVLATSATS